MPNSVIKKYVTYPSSETSCSQGGCSLIKNTDKKKKKKSTIEDCMGVV